MAANDHHSQNTSQPPPPDHDRLPVRRSSVRRKPKGCDSFAAQKKKQPQRGMGVEKLERLRLQERWKKMTEINTTNPGFNIPAAVFADPTLINTSIPVQLSKLGGFGAPNVGQVGSSQNNDYQGFLARMGVGGLPFDQHQTDLVGVGCLNNLDFVGKNVAWISKELSSNPDVKRCNACPKNKKVNGEDLGCDGLRSDTNRQINVGDSGFLGLNIGENHNIIKQKTQGHGTKGPLAPQVGFAVGNGKRGVEVVAVHKKGSSSSGGGNVLMEYEFFPVDSHNDELAMMKQSVEGSETSSSMAGISDASNCLDLSLKLSY